MIRLFRVFIPTSTLLLIVSETILLFACYILGAVAGLRDDLDRELYLIEEGGLIQIALVVVFTQLGLYFHDLYERFVPRSRILLIQQLCVILGMSFLLQAILGYGQSSLQLPKWTMLYGSMLVLITVPAWRLAFRALISRALGPQKLLFLGASPILDEISTELAARPEFGMTILGYLADEAEPQLSMSRLGSENDLEAVIQKERPDRLVVGLSDPIHGLPLNKLLEVRFSGIPIDSAATVFEQIFGRVSTRDLLPSQLIFSSDLGPRPGNLTIQNIYSFILGLAGAVISSPLMIVVAALVRLSSPGPILLRQKRVGLHGKNFTLFKFRSMYEDAEARTGAVWASKNDPRITPIGWYLRKFRLDELPQFFNVLKGEMAVAGPRPERPEFAQILEEKVPFYAQRHCVKPGITGWAQINHKYADSVEDVTVKLEYDLYYVKNLSPALDAYIIFHTLKVMLLFKGAQ